VHWDPREIPQADQFEAFHETIAPVFTTSPLVDVAHFSSMATDYLCGDLIVSRVGYDGQTIDRGPAHVSGAQTDTLAIQCYGDGFLRGVVGERDLDLHAGVVSLVDLSVPFRGWSETSDVTWVGIPRDRLEVAAELGPDDPVRSWRLDTPTGQALAGVVHDLWERLGEAPAGDGGAIADALVDDVNGLVRPDAVREDRPGERALGLEVRRHIEANLDDLDLGVPVLRDRFHCSRATLYRLFEADGGVLAHIRDRRLRRCFAELTVASGRRRTVAEVAVRWGYDSPSHFNRIFKRRFGVAPSAVRPAPWQPAALGTADDADVARFHSWVAGPRQGPR
jgi:AraC-like DNA-binding protein